MNDCGRPRGFEDPEQRCGMQGTNGPSRGMVWAGPEESICLGRSWRTARGMVRTRAACCVDSKPPKAGPGSARGTRRNRGRQVFLGTNLPPHAVNATTIRWASFAAEQATHPPTPSF